ncbi:hypothetical protein JCM10450v2_007691 [Rhodotorula kratochvilovae]
MYTSLLGEQRPAHSLFLDRRVLACGAALFLVVLALFSHAPLRSLTSRSSGEVVWASPEKGLVQAMLSAPHDNLRLTVAHAVVRRNNETYRQPNLPHDRFVSIALHIETLPYRDPAHQIHSYNVGQHIDTFTCEHDFSGESFTRAGELRHFSWLEFAVCPLPRELDALMAEKPKSTLVTTIVWKYKGGEGEFRHTVELEAHYPEAEEEFGICLSPIWGHLDARATLEWRENMRRNGVNTVHWHARDAVVGDFVNRYVKATGAKDTFMYAPPVSLETYGHRNNLNDNGVYGDQIIYYLSCKLRSHQRYPTRWIGFLDRDEDFLPRELSPTLDAATGARLPPSATANSSLLPGYFANVADDIGSICFGKGYHGRLLNISDAVPASVAQTQPLELAYFAAYGGTTLSVKCMHRVNGMELASVHYGERWYPGFRQQIHDNVTEPTLPFRFVHQTPHGAGNGGPAPYPADEFARFLGNLWIERERIWEEMRWPCSEVPCRFAPPPKVPQLPSE